MKRIINIISLLLLIVSTIWAAEPQDSTLKRNVTVEREYKPVIHDAGKINTVPKVTEAKVEKNEPQYSDFNLPLMVDFNIHTLSAAEPKQNQIFNNKSCFARFGFGNYFTTMADFSCPIVKKPTSRLDLTLNHLATFGKKALSITKGKFTYSKQYKNMEFYAGQVGGHEYYNYYGDVLGKDSGVVADLPALANAYGQYTYKEKTRLGSDGTLRSTNLNTLAKDSDNNTLWRMETVVGVRSTQKNSNIGYHAELQYKLFDSHREIMEHLFHTQVGLCEQNKENRLGADIHLYNSLYHAYNSAPLNFRDTYSVLALNPYYQIERDEYMLRLGVKSSFAFKDENAFNPSADIHVEWKAIPKIMAVYGGLTGGYTVNSLTDIFAENRYILTDIRVANTYTPFDFFAGVKIKPMDNLLLDAFLDYKSIDNQYFFVNKEYDLDPVNTAIPSIYSRLFTNRFEVLYAEAKHFKAGMRANYNLQNRLNIQAKWAYNNWTVENEQHAWHEPKWEADVTADAHITDEWTVNASLFFQGERYAKLGDKAVKMNPKVDVNIGANYQYNYQTSLFVKINNLTNNPYQSFYGYRVQGLQLMAGATLAF